MSLDITLPSWKFSKGEEKLFQEWLLMMYGGLKPTPEEMMALLVHYVEPLPIIGTAVTIQKTIVSYQNGKTMEALIRSGVVAFRVVGDILLVKEIRKTAVEFSFTDDAMEILTTSAVGQIDDVVRVGLISQLDDYEKLVRESIDDLTKNALKHPLNVHMPTKYAQQINYQSKEAVEAYLSKKTFFNPSWSEEQVINALNTGYKDAVTKGITNGYHSYSIYGETIQIYMREGIFSTGFGSHVLTY